jgi:pyroglutamyl-peptidase
MIKILVTGFGAFPGVPSNPSSALLSALKKRRRRLQRFGIALELRELPVTYAGLPQRLARLAKEIRPDAILQFGVASGREVISVEKFARNHVDTRHPDASGKPAFKDVLVAHGPRALKTRIPDSEIVAALRRAGIPSAMSNDAGDYVCNASFYHALRLANVRCVGFIHIPFPRARRGARKDKRPHFEDIVRAAEIALIIIARALRPNAALRYAG